MAYKSIGTRNINIPKRGLSLDITAKNPQSKCAIRNPTKGVDDAAIPREIDIATALIRINALAIHFIVSWVFLS